jgi:hypothetical protein
MLKQLVISAVLGVALSGTALAGHCPKDAKAINEALARSTLDDAAKAEVRAMSDKGMELHNAGDHSGSEKVLAEAMRTLLSGGLN